MGLLLGGSVLTVFELIDLIVFRFVNTLFAGKMKPAADGGEDVECGTAGSAVVMSPRSPVSAVSTIDPPHRRIRRIAKYHPPTSPPTPGPGGRPALVIQTTGTPTPAGKCKQHHEYLRSLFRQYRQPNIKHNTQRNKMTTDYTELK